jgi:Aspartyl protease
MASDTTRCLRSSRRTIWLDVHRVDYTQSNSYVANPAGQAGHVVARPWVEVTVHDDAQTVTHRIWCLVDTGADESVLDLGTAAAIGVDPQVLPQVQVRTAGGSPQFGRKTGVLLEFANTQVYADVLFGAVAVPLLGRSALVAGVEAGFDDQYWHNT